ncbi:uncharacterized protein LOC117176545 [Belonocnema kinseyi]|uniref:uncharacterized protein LOC117176545 n=1 Tax=Belonocnema kinseyi TaxID=2817044 RepID=UPI00143D376D|nr:uncharacterized protein LOC117176545 [Belonocnema kinseyi]
MWTYFMHFFFINILLTSAQVNNMISGNSGDFTCYSFGSLESCLEKAEKNTTSLTIKDSDVPRILGRAFEKFGALKSMAINLCGLKKIHAYAFIGLNNLEKLDLSQNSLTLLESSYFKYLPNLRHLDVSFNEIKAIDDIIFFVLEKLQNFYFDYNKISAVSNRMLERLKNDGPQKVSLRNVKIGRNPMNWEHRILLTRRLDDLSINYKDDWENWNWLSSTIRECQENGFMGLPGDQALNCAIEKLLDFAQENLEKTTYTPCVPEATTLVNCFKGNVTQLQNIDGIRFAIEGFGSVIKPLNDIHGRFHITPEYKTKLDHQVLNYVASQSEWAWFEDVINSCKSGLYEEAILDCEVQQLLDFTFSIFNDSQSLEASSSQTFCSDQVNSLLLCSRFTPVVDDIAARRALEGFKYILPQMDTSLGRLNEGLL